jgi:hypothetical protein
MLMIINLSKIISIIIEISINRFKLVLFKLNKRIKLIILIINAIDIKFFILSSFMYLEKINIPITQIKVPILKILLISVGLRSVILHP